MVQLVDPIEHPRSSAGGRGFAGCRLSLLVIALTGCFLCSSVANATDLARSPLQLAQAIDRGEALPGLPLPPRTGGGPSPGLPEARPGPLPQPNLTLPSSPPSEAAPPLSQGPRFILRDVNIVDNTVLDGALIRGIVDPYLGKPVTTADLEEIRRQFTLLYINHGYINSGVIIPDQNVTNGVVTFRFVEGRVTDIEVSGTDHFDPEYFRSRLARGIEPPFNVGNLASEQQILLQDPLVRRLNLELLPGLEPGEARLHADVGEANRYSLNAQIADDQVPTVGSVRGQLQGSMANILGFGDILSAEYGRSQGLNDGYVAYSVPIASDDTRVSVRYDKNGVVVITPELSALNVTSTFSSVGLGLSRPIYRTPEATFSLGASLERREQQSFLLGMPFPFTPGAEPNGKTIVTPLRLYQDWLDRDAEHAFAARSTFSVGLPTLGATTTSSPAIGTPTSNYFFWLGQAQYVRRVYEDWEVFARSDLQLANRSLFQIEQIAFGGLGSVRGYRTYLTVTDDGFLRGRHRSRAEEGQQDPHSEESNPGAIMYSEEQALKGHDLYNEHCASCHGGALEGQGSLPLSGDTFRARWADDHHSVDDLFYIIRTLMPYGQPATLSKQEYIDVIAYILMVNGYPAGTQPLPPDPRILKQITIKAQRP
jgi:hemolysin activation/secretion protein/mono/diheme cytochrome c family protein